LYNIEIRCGTRRYEGVAIGHRCVGFSLVIVYLQQTAPTTLDVTAGRIILQVREILGSGVLLLEGRDGKF
jgi:hypothetical protein